MAICKDCKCDNISIHKWTRLQSAKRAKTVETATEQWLNRSCCIPSEYIILLRLIYHRSLSWGVDRNGSIWHCGAIQIQIKTSHDWVKRSMRVATGHATCWSTMTIWIEVEKRFLWSQKQLQHEVALTDLTWKLLVLCFVILSTNWRYGTCSNSLASLLFLNSKPLRKSAGSNRGGSKGKDLS